MPEATNHKRIRLSTLLLLVVILMLGHDLDVQQHKEARLQAALRLSKSRSQGEVVHHMGRPFALDWPDGTSLSKAIEQIKQGTSRSPNFLPKGIPIYIDPDGLREAGQSLSSPVKAPPSADLPLREKLRAVLEPLGLACQVEDAALVITSRSRVDEPLTEEPEEEP